MRHHTKDKGDIGLGCVIADLLQAGIQVALPLSEHLPFDVIAISENGTLSRLQVKYRAAVKNRIECDLRATWSDSHGAHHRAFDPKSCDALAIYCPEPQACYYLRTDEFLSGSVNLRTVPARNGQLTGIRMAADYANPMRIFALLAQWTERLPSKETARGSNP